jgi:antitoxin (DNA-binding transcriptional repressor) of toxin-antitoxin stability system
MLSSIHQGTKKMSIRYTATKLRANLYKVLDQVLKTGKPVEIERDGKLLRIVAVKPPNKLDKLTPHPDYIAGNPEEIVHMEWYAEWKP